MVGPAVPRSGPAHKKFTNFQIMLSQGTYVPSQRHSFQLATKLWDLMRQEKMTDMCFIDKENKKTLVHQIVLAGWLLCQVCVKSQLCIDRVLIPTLTVTCSNFDHITNQIATKKPGALDLDLKKLPVFESVSTPAVKSFADYLYTGHFMHIDIELLPAVSILCSVFGISKEHMQEIMSRIPPDCAGQGASRGTKPQHFRWSLKFHFQYLKFWSQNYPSGGTHELMADSPLRNNLQKLRWRRFPRHWCRQGALFGAHGSLQNAHKV